MQKNKLYLKRDFFLKFAPSKPRSPSPDFHVALTLQVILVMSYGWNRLNQPNALHSIALDLHAMRLEDIPINRIRRPLPRGNDPQKVEALMDSIREIGLQEPIDVLEVDGEYYGFSGCHRYEACQRLGHDTIRCNVRRAPKAVLQRHLA